MRPTLPLLPLLLFFLNAESLELRQSARIPVPLCPSAIGTGEADFLCRYDSKHGGELLFTSKGSWVTSCGLNTHIDIFDPLCDSITRCQLSTGDGFATFMNIITARCTAHNFRSYYGRDGLTFGIMGFKAPDLIPLIEMIGESEYLHETLNDYFSSLPEFNSHLHQSQGKLCLEPKWICDLNKSGRLNCDKQLSQPLVAILVHPEVRLLQLRLALMKYGEYTRTAQDLGFKTQRGVVGVAALLHDLQHKAGCRPDLWLETCKKHHSKASEKSLLRCITRLYTDFSCGPSARAIEYRTRLILSSKAGAGVSFKDVSPAKVLQCFSKVNLKEKGSKKNTSSSVDHHFFTYADEIHSSSPQEHSFTFSSLSSTDPQRPSRPVSMMPPAPPGTSGRVLVYADEALRKPPKVVTFSASALSRPQVLSHHGYPIPGPPAPSAPSSSWSTTAPSSVSWSSSNPGTHTFSYPPSAGCTNPPRCQRVVTFSSAKVESVP